MLESFVLYSAERRLSLRPMPRWQRALAHEMASHYGLSTGSYGNEPDRRLDIFRPTRAAMPLFLLSAAAADAESGASAPLPNSHWSALTLRGPSSYHTYSSAQQI